MMMNLFNMFNCRVLPTEDDQQLNIVKNIHGNWWFLIIFLFELNVQFLLVGYGFDVFTTTPLTLGMHITAVCLGLGSLLVGVGVKFIPSEYLEKIPKVKEELTDDNILKARLLKV